MKLRVKICTSNVNVIEGFPFFRLQILKLYICLFNELFFIIKIKDLPQKVVSLYAHAHTLYEKRGK